MDNKNVYNYVIGSMNNIVNNGIEYYSDKDKNLYDRLLQIRDYINREVVCIDDVVPVEETKKEENKKINKRDSVDKQLLDKYMKKIMNIKISVLNFESDLPLYYDYSTNNYDSEMNKLEQVVSVDSIAEVPIVDEITEESVIAQSSIVDKCNDDVFCKQKDSSLLDLFKK